MPGGKSYTAVKSKAQSRLLFAKARRGELPLHEARGKTRAANVSSLPERARKRTRKGSRRGTRAAHRPARG